MGIQNSSMGDVALSPTSQGVSNISTAATSKVQPRVVAATVAGNALEFFDFTTYAFFAGSVRISVCEAVESVTQS